jgi:PAS domain S-box-containing protein
MTTKRAKPRRVRAAPPTQTSIADASNELHADSEQFSLQSEQLLRAQSELAEARNRYAVLYDLAPIGYLTLDDQGVIIEANLAAGVLCDQPRGYLIGLTLMNVVAPEDRNQLRLFTDQARIAAGGLVAKDLTLHVPSRRTVRLLGRSVRPPEGLAQVLTAMIDVTAEKQLSADRAAALAAEQGKSDDLALEVKQRIVTEARVKALLERLVTVQEEERRRIARNLHDHLGQQLTAMRLTIGALKEHPLSQTELRARLDAIDKIAAQIDHDVDFLAWNLRPAALDDVGLSAALQTVVRDWAATNGIEAEFHTTPAAARLAAESESHLYRIVQEALNNVSKHASATHVSVLLEHTDHEVRLIVEDDGRGFDTEQVAAALNDRAMGLTSMQERAALIGGHVEFESAPGRGTTVFARVPIRAGTASRG